MEAIRSNSPEGDEALLNHVSSCWRCSIALRALTQETSTPEKFDPEKFAAIRARLLSRAAADGRDRAFSRRFSLPPVTGWFVAAGLATLLLTHHTFHESLNFGWWVASVLGITTFGLGLYAFRLRRRIDKLEV